MAARDRLETALASSKHSVMEAVDTDPMGTENRPHQYTYKRTLYPEQDTVTASEESKAGRELGKNQPALRAGGSKPESNATLHKPRTDHGTVMRISTDELVNLAPRLKPYLRTASPAWPDVVDAADWLRHDLGVSRSLWGEACLLLGREQAAIALAIVSAKPTEHFTSSPGGYFHGMVVKAKTGELNLARTVWGLRTQKLRTSMAWVNS